MSRLLPFAAALVLFTSLVAHSDEKSAGIAIDDDAELEQALSSTTEIQYLDTQLGDVVTDLELRHKINIEIDVAQLKAKGKSHETPITLSLKDITLESALNALLQQEELTWTIQNQTLLITTLEAEPKYGVTKVYQVDDLGSDLSSSQGVLEQSIAPESWRKNGGPTGVIVPHAETKSLVIVQTSRNHRQVRKLLDALRTAKGKGA